MERGLGDTKITRNKLFAPEKSDYLKNRKMVGGEFTGILNTSAVKYGWYKELWDVGLQNQWIPEKTSMTNDNWDALTDAEQKAVFEVLSFLVYLDSIQTENVPNIAAYITSPEVQLLLAKQTFDEALHSQSYQWIIDSVLPKSLRNKIYTNWKDNPILLKRNKLIASYYDDFIENPTLENLGVVCFANYLLEGLYFYNGFKLFYNLGSRGLLKGTKSQIKYINRDELVHLRIFENIINEYKKENSATWEKIKPRLYKMAEEAVASEIEFSQSAIQNVLGINNNSIEQYSYYLGNKRCKTVGLDEIFPQAKNPYRHLEDMADSNEEGKSKANVFEAQSTAYSKADLFDGINDI